MIQGLSKKLTLLRQQNKLSQSEVARRIGISSSAVSAYEADQISPSLETLVKLANLFHVSTDYLLGVLPCSVSCAGSGRSPGAEFQPF